MPMTPIIIVDTYDCFQIWTSIRQSFSLKYARVSHTLTALQLLSAGSHPHLPNEKTRCEPPTLFGNPIVLLKCFIASFTAREREAAAASQNFVKNGMGYFAIQSTKPQTLGFSLADSPVGLLAWIYEKLVIGSDAYPWTDDEGKLTPTIHCPNSTQLVS